MIQEVPYWASPVVAVFAREFYVPRYALERKTCHRMQFVGLGDVGTENKTPGYFTPK